MGSPSEVPAGQARAVPVRGQDQSESSRTQQSGTQMRHASACALPRTCAVHGQASNQARGHARARHGRPDDLLLRRAVGRRQAAAAAVLVDGAAAHQQRGRAAGGRGGCHVSSRQRSADHRLSTHVAVSGGIQRAAAAVGRQHAGGPDVGGGSLGGLHVHARRIRQPRLARRQPAGRHVKAHQRGGAGGVDADAGAAQAKGVGQATAGHGQGGGGGVVGATLRVAGHQAAIVGGSDACRKSG